MQTPAPLPPELQALVDTEILRRIDENEFSIDALSHRTRTGGGWADVTYVLRIEEDDEGQPQFEITEETEDMGGDVVVCSTDADEAAYWITEQIEEKER